jgi:hypothetical protein
MKYEVFSFEILIENFFQNEVRQEYRLTGFVALATHDRKGCQLAWKYMQDNWDKIEDVSYLIHFIEV